MATALITGITGQDGSYLAERLVAEGVDVHGLVRDEPERVLLSDRAGVTPHLGDLSDTGRVAQIVQEVRPDEIYNLGGISSVGFSWDEPVLTGLVSGLGAVGVFEAARRLQDETGQQVRVVQASSAEIFGTPDRTPQDEQTAIRPVSPYGAAKAYAHTSAAVYRSRGVHVATCVLYNHESPRRPETFVTRKITAAAARIARDGGGVLAMGNLEPRRDWGWAPDYVDAMVRAVRHPEADDFVVATGVTHSVGDFVRAAFARAGIDDWQAHVELDPRFVRPADAAVQVGDAGKAQRVLGWSTSVAFDELVGRMVDHDLELLTAHPDSSR
ncbi:GDP-mannose 4,6-dehydratase [Xylanimonas allomyrinae]|uniref:GDP-mannose 4,6-dehydratase n=1 Tax=Xylanimonas allomyrinae TaxID=2509459 RepID=A0A4V0YE90_9MICO|nr:GDP-mannose 4,6-dehydratase [Xylanimonas allomyrinae]QAY63381.1 GDP-mannose 4,6-dehydratase [Xylanimonas allomyrinae]